ncbi:MAG: hypothetical protein E7310_06435 [Clostridiales bacterium]|nr:hypothetical protein [Clostridiales bacterium]
MKFNKFHLEMVKDKTFNYDNTKIGSSIDVVKLISDLEKLENLTQETMVLICLDCKNNIVGISEIAKGGINFCNIDLRNIFKVALLANACKVILVHNHPSGDSKPSNADLELTEHILNASEIMRIQLVDHIVIGENSKFTSCVYMLRGKEN